MFFSQVICAQMVDATPTNAQRTNNLEQLSVYPNPVSTGKLNIVTKNNFTKRVEIYNVLGKRILNTSLSGEELNISKIKAGVYIIKVTENNTTATRKLIVK